MQDVPGYRSAGYIYQLSEFGQHCYKSAKFEFDYNSLICLGRYVLVKYVKCTGVCGDSVVDISEMEYIAAFKFYIRFRLSRDDEISIVDEQ